MPKNTYLKRATAVAALAATLSMAGTSVAAARTVDLTAEARTANVTASAETPDESEESRDEATDPAADEANADTDAAETPAEGETDADVEAEADAEAAPAPEDVEDAVADLEEAASELEQIDPEPLTPDPDTAPEIKASSSSGGGGIDIDIIGGISSFLSDGGIQRLFTVVASGLGLANQLSTDPTAAINPSVWQRVIGVVTGGIDILKSLGDDIIKEKPATINDDVLEVDGVTADPKVKDIIQKELEKDTDKSNAETLLKDLEAAGDKAADDSDDNPWKRLNDELSKPAAEVNSDALDATLDEIEKAGDK